MIDGAIKISLDEEKVRELLARGGVPAVRRQLRIELDLASETFLAEAVARVRAMRDG